MLVEKPRQVLITTDKPLYQPGQVVHIRALAMKQPQVVPVADEKVLVEIEGPQGNKLLKEETRTDKHGIVFQQFHLAKLLNLGTYTVRVTLGSATRVKTFVVDRYTLPKFRVSIAMDRPFFHPDKPITGKVNAAYFFGKKVENGSVRLLVSANGQKVSEILGKTDTSGAYAFVIKKAYQGKLQLEAEVTDGAGATQKAASSVMVTRTDRIIQVVLEDKIVVGKEATVLILLTDPVGRPLADTVTLRGGIEKTIEIPATGVAAIKANLTSCNLSAYSGSERVDLSFGCNDASELLSIAADKAIYREGESAKLTVTGPDKLEQVKLDIVRRNIVVQTLSVALKNGVGTIVLPLDQRHRRSLQLRASASHDGKHLRARRLLYIAGNDQLNVEVKADKSSYRPGAKAQVTLEIKDQDGKPAAAAIGVQVVDEALFALSEVKPGIERNFFLLESETVKGEGLRFIDPSLLLNKTISDADQIKARMLFAASGNQATFPIDYLSENKSLLSRARSLSGAGFRRLAQRMQRDANNEFSNQSWIFGADVSASSIRTWAWSWTGGLADDFGQLLKIEVNGRTIIVRSAGMDEKWGTLDDLMEYAYIRDDSRLAIPGQSHADGGAYYADAMTSADSASMPSSDAGAPPPPSTQSPQTVRQYFPETLYVNPALITDGSGKATIDLDLADSITSWRLTAIAHSQAGQLGSNVGKITVFQEFFLDVLLPEHLLQNDEVTVPVAVYNYLGTAQTVTVSAESGSWFSLLDAAQKKVTIPARSVASVKFRIKVKSVGHFGFTASGKTASEADAVKRMVNVRPDGERKEVVFSGSLKAGSVAHTVTIPQTAIAGAHQLFVKVYPGVLAEVVEGLDSMLRQPHGCFEQTSSSTYPNVMVLQYLEEAKLVTPALKKRAQEYIAKGYQKLVNYEVKGGGFSLWGEAPASLTLTSFGLMEFYDMSKVHFVDPQASLAHPNLADRPTARFGSLPRAEHVARRWYRFIDCRKPGARQRVLDLGASPKRLQGTGDDKSAELPPRRICLAQGKLQ